MLKPILLSALFAVQFCFSQSLTLTISEIHYNSDSTKNTGDWFELHNYGSSSIDLSLFRLRDSSATGLYLVQPGVSIPAGGYLVFCSDTLQFDAEYNISNRIGNLGYGLNNNTDGIRIFDNLNNPVLAVYYQDSLPWPIGADGWGRTLELISPTADPTLPSSWRTGCIGGSPGSGFTPCVNETIVVSEINYKSAPTENAGDWFEIRNIGSSTVNISGYGVRNHKTSLHYIIPGGTILDPQEMVVLYNTPALFLTQFPFMPNSVGPFLFGLDGDGDAIRLYDANDKIIFSVYYDDDTPWSDQPDGFGYTLEADTNFNFSRDVCSAASWFAGCPEGSPGVKYNPDCLGSAEDESAPPVHVYPNPCSDYLMVTENLQGEYELILYNSLGQQVGYTSNGNTLITHNLPEGNYILRIRLSNKIYFNKVIIQHE